MAKELNEDTGFYGKYKNIDRLLGAWLLLLYVVCLQADMLEAKDLPIITTRRVTRMEFDMKGSND